MSTSLASKQIYLDIDSSFNVNSTVSFNILTKDILIDLDMYELETYSSYITYFINDKKWGVYSEGFWHMLPNNFISNYLMQMYENTLPEEIKFRYE